MTRWLLERTDALLVVVDLQVRLLPHIPDADRVVDRARRLGEAARIVGLPVLWTEQENLGETAPPLAAVLAPGSPIQKIHFGCFGSEAFVGALEATGRRTLLLCGIEAHICVGQTALQALERGYGVHVVADAVASRNPADRDVALERVRQAGGVVTCWESALYELLGRAGTDEFRACLSLVKGG
ncbi:hydrolase [Deferrisoma palaeochoriense]